MVMLGLRLKNLDEKKVMDQERRYLYNLNHQKELKVQRRNSQTVRKSPPNMQAMKTTTVMKKGPKGNILKVNKPPLGQTVNKPFMSAGLSVMGNQVSIQTHYRDEGGEEEYN